MKLRRRVHELQDILRQRDQELNDVRRTLKATKLREVEVECRHYMQECQRLRQIAEQTIQQSGQVEYEQRIKRQH